MGPAGRWIDQESKAFGFKDIYRNRCVVLKEDRMKNKWQFRLGIILILVSIVLFLSLIAIPFLPTTVSLKLTITTVDFILAEVLFYSGGLLVGKEVFTKYRQYLNPKNWFKKGPTKKTK
jgi:hypothetical protein